MSASGPAAGRIVVLHTADGVPPGLLNEAAWQLLRSASAVLAAQPGHRQLAALRAVGIEVEHVSEAGPAERAARLRRAAGSQTAVWLAGSDGDSALVAALRAVAGVDRVIVSEEVGSIDPPGARLLDVVAVMDRLRSPGGCPWDADQTFVSLAPYLLEEAYEAYQTLEDGDLDGLREELGDVLLQVCFHARLAQELPSEQRWGIDDVAAGLVEKLVRRHPHVFADRVVSGADEVVRNWATIKAQEKNRTSVADGVPLGQPALALAAKLQQRAAAAGSSAQSGQPGLAGFATPAQAVAGWAAGVAETPADRPVEAVGNLLFAAVALARSVAVDPEEALRGAARRFRDQLVEAAQQP